MIREAVARYINAWASVLEAMAQKVRCPHKWEKLTGGNLYAHGNKDAVKVIIEHYVCTSCGEHKKITMP